MNQRQDQILSAVIQEYVRTAEPVASSVIAQKFDFGISPATVRNEMVVLEEEGFLRQPHTSSGRVPTEEGYRHYLQTLRSASARAGGHTALRKAVEASDDPQILMRQIAQVLVQLSGETAIMSLEAQWNRAAGIENLFHKPDFKDMETLRALSGIVDRFDDVLRDVYDELEQDAQVWIGEENPFGRQVATIMVKYRLPGGMTGVLGLVGPLRMNYEKNIRLLGEVKTLLEDDE